MRINIIATLLLFIGVTFASCGGSDIAPPKEPGTEKPKPTLPAELKAMIGDKEGDVMVSLLNGKYPSYPLNGRAYVSEVEDNKSILNMFISKPSEVVANVRISDFKKTNTGYVYKVASYTPTEKIGVEQIPYYFKDWYDMHNLSKVVIHTLNCTNSVFDSELGIMSFTFMGTIEAYEMQNGKEIKVTGEQSVVYEYSNLKNK